jgi:hypothetical protein
VPGFSQLLQGILFMPGLSAQFKNIIKYASLSILVTALIIISAITHWINPSLAQVPIAEATININRIYPGLILSDSLYSVAGCSFILHAYPNDFGQPSSHAEPRSACSLINIR